MVKGISRQVIVLHSPDPKLFEQAIFILRDDAVGEHGVTDEMLLKEAKRLIAATAPRKRTNRMNTGPVWACGGALVTCVVWLLTLLL